MGQQQENALIPFKKVPVGGRTGVGETALQGIGGISGQGGPGAAGSQGTGSGIVQSGHAQSAQHPGTGTRLDGKADGAERMGEVYRKGCPFGSVHRAGIGHQEVHLPCRVIGHRKLQQGSARLATAGKDAGIIRRIAEKTQVVPVSRPEILVGRYPEAFNVAERDVVEEIGGKGLGPFPVKQVGRCPDVHRTERGRAQESGPGEAFPIGPGFQCNGFPLRLPFLASGENRRSKKQRSHCTEETHQ